MLLPTREHKRRNQGKEFFRNPEPQRAAVERCAIAPPWLRREVVVKKRIKADADPSPFLGFRLVLPLNSRGGLKHFLEFLLATEEVVVSVATEQFRLG